MFYTLIQISDSHIRSLSYESAFDVRFEISFDLKLLFEFITTFTTFVKTLKICYSSNALKSPYFFPLCVKQCFNTLFCTDFEILSYYEWVFIKRNISLKEIQNLSLIAYMFFLVKETMFSK